MAKGLIEESILTGIADAIREKDGTTAKMLASAMEGKIRNISTTPKSKTGTFTPTAFNTASKNITVSNVGFTPKHVVIYANPSSRVFTDGQNTNHIVFAQYGFSSNYLVCYPNSNEDAPMVITASLNSSYQPSITFTTGGFKITKGYLHVMQWRYIAIG